MYLESSGGEERTEAERNRSEGWASRLYQGQRCCSEGLPLCSGPVLNPQNGFIFRGGSGLVLNFMVLLFIACRMLHRCFQ